MAPMIRILDINPGSDGDGRKWPKHHYTRNDEYFKERIASDKWIKDLPGGPEPDVVYRLNKLPNGYAGFERARTDSKHIDRYIYGHPNGQFRSLNEFYPHFKHLMDFGDPAGCTCKQCTGNGKSKSKKKPGGMLSHNESERSSTPPLRSRFFAQQSLSDASASAVGPSSLITPFHAKRGRPRKDDTSDQSVPVERELVDREGTRDIYESFLAELRKADRETIIDMPIEETMSPDWRASHDLANVVFKQWRTLPSYVPRAGEIVLFTRNLKSGQTLEWNEEAQGYTSARSDEPIWEAGVVTQMPQEAINSADLLTDEHKEQAVNYAGFRIEPLSAPGSERKPYGKQYKHVPLHAIRPFCYWRQCCNTAKNEKSWHPTTKHALTVLSSVCVVGRYRFRGQWPHATIFARGVYIGAELILVGDTVRLLPRNRKQQGNEVTEIMVVTAIRLRFVNLDLADDDTLPVDFPLHQTCLHVSGRVYTSDPTRSFDGVGKVPISAESGLLPIDIHRQGPWYHYSDPSKTTSRIEVPYTRVLGRWLEDIAVYAWFGAQSTASTEATSLKSEQSGKLSTAIGPRIAEISRGLTAILEGRQYSRQHDKRINLNEGKTWFWADTRVEQLDLHEVNGRDVGVKDHNRHPEDFRKWRSALKAVDGKHEAVEEYQAARMAQASTAAAVAGPSGGGYGMVAASRLAARTENSSGVGMETEGDAEQAEVEDVSMDEVGDVMDVVDDDEIEDDPLTTNPANIAGESDDTSEEGYETADEPKAIVQRQVETITISDSDDEEDERTKQLAEELAKKIRANEARLR